MLRTLTASICLSALSAVFALQGAGADTIYLKNGKRIEVATAWEESGMVRGQLYGQIVGYPLSAVDHVEYDQEDLEFGGCTFDVWRSGMTAAEIIRKAELNDIPLHRDGLISSNKHFNPKTCRPYIKTATSYGYTTQLLGQRAGVRLQLTPESKKLYAITIRWIGAATEKKTGFMEKVRRMVAEKHGPPSNRRKEIIFEFIEWQTGENCRITIRMSIGGIDVTYQDHALRELVEAEKRNKMNAGFSQGEKSKF